MSKRAQSHRIDAKPVADNVADLKLHIDHRNCRLHLSTSAGPARLAIIDADGNVLPVQNVEKMMADAAVDAVLDFIDPSLQANVRHLTPPTPHI